MGRRRPSLESAIVCFYGQKTRNFFEVAEQRTLLNVLDPEKGARIYNLGGNPMMARVADGSVDIVLGLGKGHAPHDTIPGLYIATKAGAVALTPEGRPFSFKSREIKNALCHPAADEHRLRYVLAATRGLARKVVSRLAEGTSPANTSVYP